MLPENGLTAPNDGPTLAAMVGRTVLTIGNFDGVHRGHRALIERSRAVAGTDGKVVVLAFDPHPATLLRPGREPPRLTTFEQRAGLLRETGADEVVRLDPSPDLLSMAPESFIERVAQSYAPNALVEGPDFRFGRNREGTVETLIALGPRWSFDVEVIGPTEAVLTDLSVVIVSSTLVRWLLLNGRVADAAILLGRAYSFSGRVERGDQRGRSLGIPTINLLPEVMLPADGVYRGEASDPDGHWRPAAINVGRRPTFGGGRRICEAHLIGYAGTVDHYGWSSEIRFTAFLREELRFGSAEQAAAQIRRDIERARHARTYHLPHTPAASTTPSAMSMPPAIRHPLSAFQR